MVFAHFNLVQCLLYTVPMAFWWLILVFGEICSTNGFRVQNLGGEWTVHETTGKYSNLSAKVPGGIYTDLMRNKIIGDVFYGTNDTETRWVAKTNWTYERVFSVDETFVRHATINVVFEGLDTFATILINGVEIGRSENMFRRYIFDVTKALRIGQNTVVVRFVSPILMAKQLLSNHGYMVPNACQTGVIRGECHINQIRKMHASFGWDYAIAVPSMGIWKEVYLEGYDTAIIRYFLVDYEEESDFWLIKTSTYLDSTRNTTIKGKLTYEIETDDHNITKIAKINHQIRNDLKVDFNFTIPKLAVQKWWPNGFGSQNLYKVSVKLNTTIDISYINTTIGFRKIELIQDPIGSGFTFYFKVNDVPIFAKGANVVPFNILPEESYNRDRISEFLEIARRSNMNMLRVSGTSIYESDYFYQKADQLGLLIWQDFPFALFSYPTYPDFLENVKAEIRHQVKRLSNHPSLAIWAGGSETELAISYNWYGVKRRFMFYKKQYIKLIKTIQSELWSIQPKALFVSSCPNNGKKDEEVGYFVMDPTSTLFGTGSYYFYFTNTLDVKSHPLSRFVIEQGYLSIPDVDSWMTVTDDVTNLYQDGIFVEHRHHSNLGAYNLLTTIVPQLDISNHKEYKMFIFYSQIVQALSVKLGVEYRRSFMARVTSSGEGYSMGILFWSLNDVWVAPSWSAIDYTGKWKILQYFVSDFFAPTIITGFIDSFRNLQIYAVSEIPRLRNSTMDVTAVVTVYKWTSFEPVHTMRINATLEYGKGTQVAQIDRDLYLRNVGCGSFATASTNCFFHLTLESDGDVVAPHNLVLATTLKYSKFQKTRVEIVSTRKIRGTKFEISVKCDGISLFVWLNSKISGEFSENGFTQIVPVKNVTFEAKKKISLSVFKESLTVIHLNSDEYYKF